ncbi:hypothetical protein [Photorhabdus luminescens]|uniref:hypothetical protein n=1 Tax=Photorhabdus luminescens TaxID=29488 RepID=UPI002240747E|nr:hypothetical protein [Photorhabdus luminescens]MCW7761197.1 hypothetical protein [Photorhabdus luminescens subsp. venezuelensis]
MSFDSIFSFGKDNAETAQNLSKLLENRIPGSPADPNAKIIKETSPEALAVMGFLNGFMGTVQKTSQTHSESFNDPKTTGNMASSSMKEGSKTVDADPDIKKASDSTKAKGDKNT